MTCGSPLKASFEMGRDTAIFTSYSPLVCSDVLPNFCASATPEDEGPDEDAGAGGEREVVSSAVLVLGTHKVSGPL